jgi:hypothetical protein
MFSKSFGRISTAKYFVITSTESAVEGGRPADRELHLREAAV